jgi:hypothetical protein
LRPEEVYADRERSVATIADALLAGEPVPDLWVNKPKVSLEIDSATFALRQIARQLGESLEEHGGEFAALNFEPKAETGTALVTAIQQALDNRRTGIQAGQERRDTERRYDVAMERFGELKREYLRDNPLGNGDEASHLMNASAYAKREMGPQAADLAPYGKPDDIGVRGNVLGRATLTPEGVEA